MNWRPNRRDFLAAGAAVTASAGLFGTGARAQADTTIRVGAVFPSRSGQTRTLTSINDFVGAAARQGSMLAESRLGTLDPGLDLFVLQASSPTPEAAVRAAERLIELEDVDALLGGVGEGQLEALIPLAEQAGIPLFNIGTQADRFRGADCARHVFHVEASDAMYLDAIVQSFAAQGYRRWFLVHFDTPHGQDMQTRAVRAIERYGEGGEAVGAASTFPGQPVYYDEIDRAVRADADVILVMLDAIDQIAFYGMLQTSGAGIQAVSYPDPVTQTRDYALALRQLTRGFTPDARFHLWDPTLEANGAAEFNEAYLGRFSGIADPTAWSAYAATKVFYETVRAVGSTDTNAIIEHLESGAEFDLFKGAGTSFRPWDHQLRQPLYQGRIAVDLEVEQAMVGATIPSQLGIVEIEAALPGGETAEALDQLGDGPEASSCRF